MLINFVVTSGGEVTGACGVSRGYGACASFRFVEADTIQRKRVSEPLLNVLFASGRGHMHSTMQLPDENQMAARFVAPTRASLPHPGGDAEL